MKAGDIRYAITAVAILILTSAGDVAAQTAISGEGIIFPDGSKQTTAPGQEFLRVAGSNFVPRDSDMTFTYGGAGCLVRDSGVSDQWFTYDLQLPDGALLDYLRVYYYDNNATYDVYSELWAFDGAGGTNLIAEADSSGTPGYSSTGSGFFEHIVDNGGESLVVVVGLPGGVGSSLRVCGIRVRYQSPGTFEPVTLEPPSSPPPDPLAPDNAEQDLPYEE